MLLGLLRPTSGRAFVVGFDAWREPVAAHRRMAYVPGDFVPWPDLTGAETLELLANVHGSVDRGYRDELVRRFALDVNKKGRAYSKGNRQKLVLVAALATRADLLVLDEPTSGLDPLMEVVFRESVVEAKARGQSVLLSSHILSEVEATCDRVGVLRTGSLVDSGRVSELGHLRATRVEVRYRGVAPKLDGLRGVQVVGRERGAVSLDVTGSIDAVIKALAGSRITSMTSRPPSLEDVFVTYYGDGA
jgi:ABC-2 type transport system ATP-binding protein